MKTNNLLKLSLLALLSVTTTFPMNHQSTNQDTTRISDDDVNLSMAVLIYKILESSDKSLRVTGRKRARSHSATNPLSTNLSLQKKLKKIHACKQCGYRAEQTSNLTRHMHTHTGEKPFACKQCGYRTAHGYSIIRHMRTHTGEKPFACTHKDCTYRAAQMSSLKAHMLTHTGELFACTRLGCTYRATQRGNIKAHMRSKKHKNAAAFSTSSSSGSVLLAATLESSSSNKIMNGVNHEN